MQLDSDSGAPNVISALDRLSQGKLWQTVGVIGGVRLPREQLVTFDQARAAAEILKLQPVPRLSAVLVDYVTNPTRLGCLFPAVAVLTILSGVAHTADQSKETEIDYRLIFPGVITAVVASCLPFAVTFLRIEGVGDISRGVVGSRATLETPTTGWRKDPVHPPGSQAAAPCCASVGMVLHRVHSPGCRRFRERVCIILCSRHPCRHRSCHGNGGAVPGNAMDSGFQSVSRVPGKAGSSHDILGLCTLYFGCRHLLGRFVDQQPTFNCRLADSLYVRLWRPTCLGSVAGKQRAAKVQDGNLTVAVNASAPSAYRNKAIASCALCNGLGRFPRRRRFEVQLT